MKKFYLRAAAAALVLWAAIGSARAADLLVPVGRTIGLRLDSPGVTVVDFQEEPCPARAAGLKTGDVILKAGDVPIDGAEDLLKAVSEEDEAVELTVRRKGELRQVTVEPAEVAGARKLGIYVRDGITGIGTVTYYNPETGDFGALGHGVNTADGSLAEMERGVAMESKVVEITRGQAGKPGQLKGAFSEAGALGELTANTPAGLFGKSAGGWTGEPLPVAAAEEIRPGPARILSNVFGSRVESYEVEIIKVIPGERADGRNLLLRVKDERLLSATGGIVQGMSGSPIIQSGKLVGAVTHVLVNDPTTGYGIFIENMLKAAG